ncbi:MAG: flap endonuclease [Nitriliruptor sp.]|nr:MAG: flap endonuclease [Nitriliruptor sp.]
MAGHGDAAVPARLHLVDGTYELFRAHFSKRPARTDPAGRDVKATVGLVSSLLALLDDEAEAVTHLGVAFDRPIESWRNEVFEGYKSSEGVDPALLAQLADAEVAVGTLGVHVWRCERVEADDQLASAAVRFAPEVGQARILTPDKDLAQVVQGSRIIQVDRARGTERDEDAVRERFGVAPDAIPDLLALVGDDADGIPGLPGIGAKTAATLLGHYGELEAIPEDPAAWEVPVRGATRIAATLTERRDEALRYRELTRLATDLDPGVVLADLAFDGVPRGPYLDWCDALGLGQLRDRPRRWA